MNRLLVAAWLVAASMSPTLPVASAQTSSLAGTYHLLLCRGGCGSRDTSRAYLSGTVVLERMPFAIETLPPATREHFRLTFSLATLAYAPIDSAPRPNGCFVVQSVHSLADSYAGIERVGLLLWRQSADGTVSFDIFRSPDAGYSIAVRRLGEELRGHGDSDGAGVTRMVAPSDSVLGWRVGPPSRRPCIDAVLSRSGATPPN